MSVPASRRYLPGTIVLKTSWGTGAGWVIVRDVLLMGPWHPIKAVMHVVEADEELERARSPWSYR